MDGRRVGAHGWATERPPKGPTRQASGGKRRDAHDGRNGMRGVKGDGASVPQRERRATIAVRRLAHGWAKKTAEGTMPDTAPEGASPQGEDRSPQGEVGSE